MGWDYSVLRFWFTVLQFAATVGVGVYAWWVARGKETKKAIDDVRDECHQGIDEVRYQVHSNDRRLDRLESKLDAKPGHDDLKNVHSELSGLRSDVSKMLGTMQGLNRAVDLMTEHMINKTRG